MTPMDKQARLTELRSVLRCGDSIDPRPWPFGAGPWLKMLTDMDSIDGLVDLINMAQPKRVLELGSCRGGSTEVFLLMCDEVVAMDPWGDFPELSIASDRVMAGRERKHIEMLDDNGKRFMAKCGAYPNLTTIRDFSPRGVEKMLPKYAGYFDMVYIDAVHEYQAVINDVHASWPLVRPGGWIAGHDYQPLVNFKDMIPAINMMFGAENIVTFRDSSWLVRRPDVAPPYDELPKSTNGDAPPDLQLPRPPDAYPPTEILVEHARGEAGEWPPKPPPPPVAGPRPYRRASLATRRAPVFGTPRHGLKA